MGKKITYPFKVNTLNKRGKETWQYVTTIEQAMELRAEAQNNGINSNVFEKINGRWYKPNLLLSADVNMQEV